MVYSKLNLNIHSFAPLFCFVQQTERSKPVHLIYTLNKTTDIRGFTFLFIQSLKLPHVQNYKFLLLVLKDC
jgi:hypothetical protein